MSQTVADIDTLKQYIGGVMDRADHHAKGINEIALALVGAIVWKKDSAPIKVMTREGEMTNVLWVSLGGKRFAFSYNHIATAVEMREGSTQGAVHASFDNSTSISYVRQVFEAL